MKQLLVPDKFPAICLSVKTLWMTILWGSQGELAPFNKTWATLKTSLVKFWEVSKKCLFSYEFLFSCIFNIWIMSEITLLLMYVCIYGGFLLIHFNSMQAIPAITMKLWQLSIINVTNFNSEMRNTLCFKVRAQWMVKTVLHVMGADKVWITCRQPGQFLNAFMGLCVLFFFQTWCSHLQSYLYLEMIVLNYMWWVNVINVWPGMLGLLFKSHILVTTLVVINVCLF